MNRRHQILEWLEEDETGSGECARKAYMEAFDIISQGGTLLAGLKGLGLTQRAMVAVIGGNSSFLLLHLLLLSCLCHEWVSLSVPHSLIKCSSWSTYLMHSMC